MMIMITIIIYNKDKLITYRMCTWSGYFLSMALFNPHENHVTVIIPILDFFVMWTIFKVFFEFVMILFLFLFFGHVACVILASQPGTEPTPSALKSKVLTPGLSGKSHYYLLR